jgi:hypothetical protein
MLFGEQQAQKAYAEAEEGAAKRTLGLQALQCTTHGVSLLFHSVGQGATHSRFGAMSAGEVVGKMFDAF